jgi:hypothetical protein
MSAQIAEAAISMSEALRAPGTTTTAAAESRSSPQLTMRPSLREFEAAEAELSPSDSFSKPPRAVHFESSPGGGADVLRRTRLSSDGLLRLSGFKESQSFFRPPRPSPAASQHSVRFSGTPTSAGECHSQNPPPRGSE